MICKDICYIELLAKEKKPKLAFSTIVWKIVYVYFCHVAKIQSLGW